MKTKNQTVCAFDENVYEDSEATFAVIVNGATYEFGWSTNKIVVGCTGANCNSSYTKTYTKENGLSMEDVFNVWEQNILEFAVMFDKQNGEDIEKMWVTKGKSIKSVADWEYYYNDHDKDNSIFANWKLNGEVFNPDMAITAPITLVATYTTIPGKPILTIGPEGEGHDYYAYDSDRDVFQYHLTLALTDEYDGFDVYEENGPEEPAATGVGTNVTSIEVATNAYKTYYAKAYVLVDGEKHHGPASDGLDFHPIKYAVSFDTDGGSLVDTQYIPYGERATEPAQNPEKAHFTFDKWVLNNQEFDFSTRINDNIELLATWTKDFNDPVLGVLEQTDPYEYRIYLSNYNDYCTNNGQCAMVSTDSLKITGYRLYEVTNNGDQLVGNFAPYEYATITIEPNVTKTYVAVVYVTESATTIESDYSSSLVIDTTIPTPLIAFNPNYGTPDPTNDVENWIYVTNISAYCMDTNCTDYKVDSFEV